VSRLAPALTKKDFAATMNVLAIIIARGGSQGLKDKHLVPLLGKPVISYTLGHARASKQLTRIVVSSDSAPVRRLAEREFFETIARPAELATADSSVQDVLLHALRTVEGRCAFRADAIALLYGNVPVRPTGVIDLALTKLTETGCDSVRSFCPVGKYHPGWMARLDVDRVAPLHPGSIHRRQDLEPLFVHDGAIVAVSRAALLSAESDLKNPHAFFGSDRRAVVTEIGRTVEIDELRDLFWAEAVLRTQAGERPLPPTEPAEPTVPAGSVKHSSNARAA
jgi:CMP-N-acetylneuraminic acid synthetase